MKQPITAALLIFLGLASSGLADGDHDNDKDHAVFAMTNSAGHNEVWTYRRKNDGNLVLHARIRTGGRGSGGKIDPLGSQGGLFLNADRGVLYAVNAGSGDISIFNVDSENIHLLNVVPSGGSAPVAIAQWKNLVYVLNFAGNSNVVGFRTSEADGLRPIPNSIRYLSTSNSGASSLAFSPDGQFLLVTEKLTNNIDVFAVQSDGTLGPIVVNQDAAPGLFAVAFAPDGAALAVETGPAGGVKASTISSFLVGAGGTLARLSPGVPALGAGTCWHVVTPDGRFVYTANSASSSVSGFSLSGAGDLTALAGTVVASFPAGTTNLDIAVSSDQKYLYTLNAGSGSVGVFKINPDGSLTSWSLVPGIWPAAGFNGLAAY